MYLGESELAVITSLQESIPGIVEGVAKFHGLKVKCQGGKLVGVDTWAIVYEVGIETILNADKLNSLPLVAISLGDPAFREAGIEQIVADAGTSNRSSQGISDALDQFVDQACQTAGCNGGENCLLKRKKV